MMNFNQLDDTNNRRKVVLTCASIKKDLDGQVDVHICEPSEDGTEIL